MLETAALPAAPTFPAAFTCHPPSGPTDTCDEHRGKLERLFSFLGIHVHVAPAPAGATCTNCTNEAAAASW